jgi:hypothetical protein
MFFSKDGFQLSAFSDQLSAVSKKTIKVQRSVFSFWMKEASILFISVISFMRVLHSSLPRKLRSRASKESMMIER